MMVDSIFDKKKPVKLVLELNGAELRDLANLFVSVDNNSEMSYYHPIAEKAWNQLMDFKMDYEE